MAPRRGARVVKVDHIIDYENLTVKEVLCPICRSILIEPVMLPCNHVFCSSCFHGTMANANLVCPLCRIRIGSWLRSSKKENKLINVDYWNAIKKLFPVQIKNKLDGIEENLDFETPMIRIAEPGELKKEYEALKHKETETFRKEREAEVKASEVLIKKIREEEEYQKCLEDEKLRLDEEIAKKLAKELNCSKCSNDTKDIPGSQSTSLRKSNSNHVKKCGPLDRYLISNENVKSSIKTDQSKKIDFTNKEYTCRILCNDIGTNQKTPRKITKKGGVEINLKNFSFISRKLNAELERLRDVDDNSDSCDSIDLEYRHFKPLEYRQNLTCHKVTPVKVPSVKAEVTQNEICAPKGRNVLQLNPSVSAFAKFFDPIEGNEIRQLRTRRLTIQPNTRRKSVSPEKKKILQNSTVKYPEKKCLDAQTKNINSAKKNSPEKSSQNTISETKLEKMNSGPKRKICYTDKDNVSPRKKNKTDTDSIFDRDLYTPSSPILGFGLSDAKEMIVVTANNKSEVEQTKSPQKVYPEVNIKKIKLQEKADYELAKRLQEQYNSYSTRSNAPRRRVKGPRQTTLDNILTKKSYKV